MQAARAIDKWLRCTRAAKKYICSRFAGEVLEDGGWQPPLWFVHQYVPETPNDLQFALTEKGSRQ